MSLRDYIQRLDTRGVLITVTAPISKTYEIAGVLKQLEPKPVLVWILAHANQTECHEKSVDTAHDGNEATNVEVHESTEVSAFDPWSSFSIPPANSWLTFSINPAMK